MEDFSISYIKKNQVLEVLRSGGLDVASKPSDALNDQ